MITKEEYIYFLEIKHRELVNKRKYQKTRAIKERKWEWKTTDKFHKDDIVWFDDSMVVLHKSTYHWLLIAIYDEFIKSKVV